MRSWEMHAMSVWETMRVELLTQSDDRVISQKRQAKPTTEMIKEKDNIEQNLCFLYLYLSNNVFVLLQSCIFDAGKSNKCKRDESLNM